MDLFLFLAFQMHILSYNLLKIWLCFLLKAIKFTTIDSQMSYDITFILNLIKTGNFMILKIYVLKFFGFVVFLHSRLSHIDMP